MDRLSVRSRLPLTELPPPNWRGFEESEGGYPIALGHDTLPVWVQLAFRWRKDDGSETTATWWAANNTNPAAGDIPLDANFRIRFEIEETATASPAGSLTAQLQYNLNSAGWNNVTAASSVVRAAASPNLADGAATTNLVDTSARAFQAGEFDEVNGATGAIAGLSNESTNVEFCVQLRSADVVAADVIQLRVINGSTALDTYTATPSYTYTLADPGGSFPLTDTFTDTDGIVAQSHTPDSSVGGDSIWQPLGFDYLGAASAVNGEINTNRMQSLASAANSRVYRNTAVPATAEYDVEATLTNTLNTIHGRLTASGISNTAVDRYHYQHSATQRRLEKTVAGSLTNLDSLNESTGASETVKLELRNATKKAYAGGVEKLSSSDNVITQVGRAGFGCNANGAGIRYIDTFSATDAAVGGSVEVTPGAASLAITGQTPTVFATNPQNVAPGAGSMGITAQTPTLLVATNLLPGAGSLAITGQAPAAAVTLNQFLFPGAGSLALSPQTPTVFASDNQNVAPGSLAAALTAFAASVAVAANVELFPSSLAAALTAFAATVAVPRNVAPGAGSLSLTAFAPSVALPVGVSPGAASLALTAFAAVVAATQNLFLAPGAGSLSLSPQIPTVGASANVNLAPGALSAALTAFAATVAVGGNQNVAPGALATALSAFAAVVSAGANIALAPGPVGAPITAVLTANGDDGYEAVGSGLFTLTTRMGISSDVEEIAFLRFPNVDVPQGANLVSAQLDFSITSIVGAGPNVTFYGVDADDAAAFASPGNLPSNATTTTASQSFATGTTGAKSVDVTPIVQAIIDRGGWAANNAIALLARDNTGPGTGDHDANVVDFPDASAPVLTVEYQVALSAQMPTAELGGHQNLFPGSLASAITAFAATVVAGAPQVVSPGAGSLVITGQTPTVQVPVGVTPGALAAALTTFAATVAVSDPQNVSPGALAAALTAFSPTVAATAGVVVVPGSLAAAITAFAASVSVPREVAPGALALALTPFAALVAATAHVAVLPGAGSLSITGQTPVVAVTANVLLRPGSLLVTLTPFAATVVAISVLGLHNPPAGFGGMDLVPRAGSGLLVPRPAAGFGDRERPPGAGSGMIIPRPPAGFGRGQQQPPS